MIVKNLPTGRSLLNYQCKRSAGCGRTATLENEAGSDQGQGWAQRTDFHFFEVKTVTPGTRLEPGGVVLANEIETVSGSAAVHA